MILKESNKSFEWKFQERLKERFISQDINNEAYEYVMLDPEMQEKHIKIARITRDSIGFNLLEQYHQKIAVEEINLLPVDA